MMLRRRLLIWTVLWPVVIVAAIASLGAEPGAQRIFRDRVQPHWFADNTRFWYRADSGSNAYEYVVVDAEKGSRQSAFDHTRLAGALMAAGVKEVVPNRLPLEDIAFDPAGGAVQFRVGGKGWRFNLVTHILAERPLTNSTVQKNLGLENAPRASLRTGEETTLTFINRTSEEVTLYWLDAEGERQSYGKLRPDETRAQHTFAGHIWLVADGTGKPLAIFEADEAGGDAEINGQPPPSAKPPGRARRRNPPSDVSPDGHWRAFVKDHNLWLRNVESGREAPLSTNGTAETSYSDSVHWSPDSKKLAALLTRKGDDRKVYLVDSSPKDQLQPKLQSYDYLKPGDRVAISKPHLFDVAAVREIPVDDSLFANPWSIDGLRWSLDSSRFYFLYNQRGHQVLRVVAVDASTGKARAIIDETSTTFIDYSGKFFCEYADAGAVPGQTNATGPKEIIWMSERDGWNHLYLYDAETGQVKSQITHGAWVLRGVDRVDTEKRQVWFRAGGMRPGQDPYYVHFCRVDFDGRNLVMLTEGNGTHAARFSPDRRFFIDTWSRADLPPVNELRRSSDGSLACKLEEADAREIIAGGWRAPEQFIALGRDGQTDIYGLIHWPKNFDPQKKYPVVESIYAGPQDSFVPKSFHVSSPQQKLTERGFIVVQIDGMGTANRSKQFHDICWKNLGDAGFPDRILWLRAAAEKFPALDLGRVGIYGTSAGGQSALRALLAHGDFYQAAVADCGCHDNRMDKIWWNEQWMGWPVGSEYAEQSNVTQAHKLKGKLLLMVGELDQNVDPASTMQVVNALIKADKDFDLLVVPGAGHGVLGTPYCQRRMLDFFERTLASK